MNNEKEALIIENTGIVYFVVHRLGYTKANDNYEDLIQVGMVGLVKAANTFDATKDVKLVTYATHVVTIELYESFRKTNKHQNVIPMNSTMVRTAGSENKKICLSDVIADDKQIDDELLLEAERSLVREAVETLSEKEQRIVRALYGIGQKKLKQREVAVHFGISQSYVSRIRTAALKKLRQYIVSRW